MKHQPRLWLCLKKQSKQWNWGRFHGTTGLHTNIARINSSVRPPSFASFFCLCRFPNINSKKKKKKTTNHEEEWEEVGSFHRVWLFAILGFKQNHAHSVLLTHEKRRARKGKRGFSLFLSPCFKKASLKAQRQLFSVPLTSANTTEVKHMLKYVPNPLSAFNNQMLNGSYKSLSRTRTMDKQDLFCL